MKKYELMTRSELASARTQVWLKGDNPKEQAKIEKAFIALEQADRKECTVRRSLRKRYGGHRRLI